MDAKRLDLVVLFMMAIVSIYSGHMFLTDLSDQSSVQKDILAILEQGKNVVKVRPGGASFWKDARTNDQLGNRDLIYTHNDSGASIRLKLGGKISLHENTLFRLVQGEKGNPLFDLKKGAIKAFLNKGETIKISGDRSVISTGNSEVLIYNEGGKKKLSLVKGKLSLKGLKKAINVSRGQEVTIDQSNRIVVAENLIIDSAYPPEGKVFHYLGWQKIDFSWKSPSITGAKKVILSRDPSFEKFKTVNKSIILKKGGRYYWKAGVQTKNGIVWSNPLDFSLERDIAPKVLFPRNKSIALEVDPLDQNDSSFVVVRWMDSGADLYNIELTGPDGLKKQLQSETNQIPVDLFGPGEYSIRVSAKFDDRIVEGAISSFTVAEKSRPVVPALIFPKDHASFSVFDKNGIGVRFTWHSPMLDSQSIIEILDLKGNLVTSENIEGSSTFIRINRFGTFKWRVRTKSGQQLSDFSPENVFSINYTEINAKYPETGTKFELSRPKQTVRFEWGGAQKAKLYLYELSKNEAFTNIVYSKKVRGKKINVNFPSTGVFFWRTKVIDEEGKLSFSKPVKVIVTPTPPPEAPVLDPTQYFEIDLREGGSSFIQKVIDFIFPAAYAANETEAVISWKKYSNAARYELEIYRDPDGKKLVVRRSVSENTFRFINPEPGDYYWRIAIVDHWGRKGPFSNFAKMTLKLSERLSPLDSVNLLLPRHLSKVSGSVSFKWRSVTRASRYRIELSSDLSFNRPIFKKNVNGNSIEIKVDRYLTDGTLFWRVVALDSYGNSSVSKRRALEWYTAPKKLAVKKEKIIPINIEAAISLGASSFDYDINRNSNQYQFDGIIPNFGASVEASRGMYYLSSDISVSKGLVYSQDFFPMDFGIYIGRNVFRFQKLKIIAFIGGRTYLLPLYDPPSETDGDPTAASSMMLFGPSVRGKFVYDTENWRYSGICEFGALGITSYLVGLKAQYQWKQYYIGPNFMFKGIRVDSGDDADGNLTQASVSVSGSYFFGTLK